MLETEDDDPSDDYDIDNQQKSIKHNQTQRKIKES